MIARLGAVCALAVLSGLAAPAQITDPDRPRILSAFFGLDDSRRIFLAAFRGCGGDSGTDGMPVVFSHEVDAASLDAEDFRITTASGDAGRVACVTLRPADEIGERRTALLIGQFGSADDPPAEVRVVADVTSLDGTANFRGAAADVIPLEAGPTLILAEALPPNGWDLGGPGDCPREGLRGIVRATWTGGVTRPGGDEIGPDETRLYRLALQRSDGSVVTVAPMAVGDLGDNDNNHDLCLDVAGAPVRVSFPAGAVTDPNGDLNPDTEVAVSQALAD